MRRPVSILLVALLTLPVCVARGDAPVAPPRALATAAARAELPESAYATHVVDLATGAPLASWNAFRPLVPASTMKVLTTACALDELGPAWTTSTELSSESSIGADGVLRGSLYVRAGGDPLLRGEDLWIALRELDALGLRRVTGDVVVDAGLFDAERRPASWPSRRVIDPYDAPQGAFTVSWNSLQLVVRPAARPGRRPTIDTFPLRDVGTIVNRARTDRRTALRATLIDEPGSAGKIVVSGTIAHGARPWREWVHLEDPLLFGLDAVSSLLAEAGIVVDGTGRGGATPDDARRLSVHRSQPLAQLVRAINKYSSNSGSEILLKHLGAATSDEGLGTTAGGLAALEECLARWGVPTDGLVLADGSGYARSNRLTAAALTGVLVAADAEPSWGPELLVSLPRAGEDGSLKRRLESWEGRLRAKTGSLRDVKTLAGYARLGDGRRVAFAVIANRPRGGLPSSVLDALVNASLREAERMPTPAPAIDADQKGKPIEN